jgi:poly(hydroxyalkanoate) depolymerase family esterase
LRIAVALVLFASVAHAAGQFLDGTSGPRNYKLYVPGGYHGSPTPLVLMLHGCTQDPTQFSTGTQMNNVAEANGFLVLYPDQPTSIQSLKCWQWFDAANQKRGVGEPAALVAMLDQIASMYKVDTAHVYVAGISAGAAMAVVMGATYPDRFAAIGVASGVEYAATTQGVSGSASVQSSGGPDPAMQGHAAFTAMGAVARSVPVIVFHGTADMIVAPVNGDQVVAQWNTTDGLAGAQLGASPDTTNMGTAPGGRTYTTTTWKDARTGTTTITKVVVDGMGHAWSGGNSAGSYTDPMGPDASTMAWMFFSGSPPAGTTGGTDGGTGNGDNPNAQHSGCSYGSSGGGSSSGGGLSPAAGLLALAFAFVALRRRRYR